MSEQRTSLTPNALLGLHVPLVLASGSPRRKSLMEHVGYTFDVVVPNVDESVVSTSIPPATYVEELALLKAQAGASMVSDDALVIGSDTTVVLNGSVLNKPESSQEAVEMLTSLSGNTHQVYTGIAIVEKKNGAERSRVVHKKTEVTFRDLTPTEIDAYVQSGSPLDKAGSYGIQDDFGSVFVSHINGCYTTIVGLPMELLYSTLKEMGQGASSV